MIILFTIVIILALITAFAFGYRCVVAHGWEEARKELEMYLMEDDETIDDLPFC